MAYVPVFWNVSYTRKGGASLGTKLGTSRRISGARGPSGATEFCSESWLPADHKAFLIALFGGEPRRLPSFDHHKPV